MPKKKQVMHFLKTYRFLPSEKDPIIDQVHTLMEDEGVSIADIHQRSGLSKSTLYNWFDGPTRRPQYATVCAALHAVGYTFAVERLSAGMRDQTTIQAEPPKLLFKRTKNIKKVKSLAVGDQVSGLVGH